ncbi:MAG: T9SS type A sorting domain-containing protein [Bacteroidota bacterium]
MRIRTIAILFTGLLCLGLTACQEILFAKKAKGRNPLELVGEYYFSMQEGTKDEANGLLEFKHLGNSQYELWLENKVIFTGEIVAHGDDYLINWPDSNRAGYWHISSFRLQEDSAYNLLSAFLDPGQQQNAIEVEKYFKRYELVEQEEGDVDSTYFVKNRRREVYKAFEALNDQAIAEGEGIYLQKLHSPDPLEEAGPAERLNPILQIGPNPFIDHINLTLAEARSSRITLLSIDGKTLQQTQFEGNTFDWRLNDLASGIYILRWEDLNSEKSESFRIVKQ